MTNEALLHHLTLNPFVLAPMAGITDRPFRSFMREMGCGIVLTELVSATGLKFSSEKTKTLMRFSSDQHPVGIQIFGEDLNHLSEAAKVVEDMGADFVDLNFGCPVPKVVKKGAGSAILKDMAQLERVLRKVKSSVSIPVTIKVRTGWDASSRNTDAVAHIAHNEGICWVAVHGRTRAQGYSGLSDWDYIKWVKSSSRIPIIGNGDITSAGLACQRLNESKCDGVMIGRGCLKNPWIFQEARALWTGVQRETRRNFHLIFRNLLARLEESSNERAVPIQIKKFASWYSSGYPGSGQFRRTLFQSQSQLEILRVVEDFFGSLSGQEQKDTSSEPFLMGGHG